MLFASTVIGLLLGFSSPISLLTAVPVDNWHPEVGDVFLVDTKDNMGYLVHADGVFTTFKVGSGKRQIVHYIGRTYDATTPERTWLAEGKVETQTDRVTFGKDGRFLRLSGTPYGIHPTLYGDNIMKQEIRYESMGCILVTDVMMKVIEETFALNGNRLEVVTSFGLEGLQNSLAAN